MPQRLPSVANPPFTSEQKSGGDFAACRGKNVIRRSQPAKGLVALQGAQADQGEQPTKNVKENAEEKPNEHTGEPARQRVPREGLTGSNAVDSGR
jgi:hypothetical protein